MAKKQSVDTQQTIVAIGASAGGLTALQSFFDAMIDDPGMAFVVVTHMAPDKESMLPDLLQKHTAMPVRQVKELVTVERNHIYVIPPGQSIVITDTHLDTKEFEQPHGYRTPIDTFFRSLAEVHRDAVAIILSGGGTDGSVGVKAIKEQGGILLVQDPTEAEYESMPRAAIATGLVDLIAPVAELAKSLIQCSHNKSYIRENPSELTQQEWEHVQSILTWAQNHTGNDFSHYKRSTILRRIQHRMLLTGYSTIDAYLTYLHHDEDEARKLFNDLLIGVTNFFRDKEAWEALQTKVIPELFVGKQRGEKIRVWSAGCSTGEEAYSLGMLLLEQLSQLEKGRDDLEIQIFASDLDEQALNYARKGLYPKAIEADISQERLQRFFSREGDYYRVRRELRNIVIFAHHSVYRDPPFAHLNLISCRNLLIYLKPEMQSVVIDIFHYALYPEGFLFLGKAESAEMMNQHFRALYKKHRIYRARPWKGKHPNLPSLPRMAQTSSIEKSRQGKGEIRRQPPMAPGNTAANLHKNGLEAYGPPSILIDEKYQVLHISETAGRYLEPRKGPITSDLLKLVRPELHSELQSALYRAFEKNRKVVTPPVYVRFNGKPRPVVLSIRPIPLDEEKDLTNQSGGRDKQQQTSPAYALVFFLEHEPGEGEEGESLPKLMVNETAGKEHDTQLVEQMQAEVMRLRERLRATVEEYELSDEELKATNEELQSINEEYRSTTEELETNKEELQSTNEELQTVNAELKTKLEEISRAHSDLQNLMQATEIATLFLDRNLLIRRYTSGFEELFNIRSSDIGRPISHLTHHLDYEGLAEDIREVLDKLVPIEREAHMRKSSEVEPQRWFLVRLRPYRTLDDHIDGVVATFIDVTDLKQTEGRLRQQERDLAALNETLEERVEERTKQVQQLARQLTMAEQEERNHIAHMLHDDLQQHLYSLQLQVKFLEDAHHKSQPEAIQNEIDEIEGELEQAIRLTRMLSIDLSPPILYNEGLTEAIGWLATQVREQHGLKVTIEADHSFPIQDEGLRVLLYQSVRELLFNVVKHAETHTAQVSLEFEKEDDHIRITVVDRGRGFDPMKVLSERTGFGLETLRHRLNLIGGQMEIESDPGSGSRIIIVSPLSLEPY